MTEDEFYQTINNKIGYQAYVSVTHKPLPQPQKTPNPFGNPPTEPKDLWIMTRVEVGLTTLFGNIAMGSGITFDLAMADIKKNHPYLFP